VLVWKYAVIRDAVVSITVYLLGLTLLLATSLRGWFITGHDIQREYTVFELTRSHGLWSIENFRDAYNACLSIPILPTLIAQLVRVDDPYVFKFFFQVLFAACPVMVFLLARRYWSRRLAILSVVYFVGFTTFFTDMPFLNRQEIAFIFLGLAYLALTRRQWSAARRRTMVILAGLGMGLCHYSTVYVFIGTLAIAWALQMAVILWGRFRRWRQGSEAPGLPGWSDATRIVTPLVIVSLALVAFLWGGPVTHTSGGISTTVEEALPQVFGTAGGGHSRAAARPPSSCSTSTGSRPSRTGRSTAISGASSPCPRSARLPRRWWTAGRSRSPRSVAPCPASTFRSPPSTASCAARWPRGSRSSSPSDWWCWAWSDGDDANSAATSSSWPWPAWSSWPPSPCSPGCR
jgi:hypothetical protein